MSGKIRAFEDPLLSESLYLIHKTGGEITVETLCGQLNCHEKKLYRLYNARFDLPPQDYIRIARFRRAQDLVQSRRFTLTDVAHRCGYYDQSHFIREVKFFTSFTPKACAQKILNIDNTVFLSLQ